MPKDTDQIVVGANGTVRVAPTGSTEPANIDAAWAAEWVDLGYLSEDGVTVRDGRTQEDIAVWQMFYPARTIVTGREFTLAMSLRQFAGHQIEFAFGGGEVTADGAGQYRYAPPSPEVIDHRMMGVEWVDGDKHYRLIVPKGLVAETVETRVVRSGPSDLPITFKAIGQEGVDAWYLLTDDPTFAEAT